MARASTKTLLSLDRWAEVLGIHPLHFNQIYMQNPDGGMPAVCSAPTLQYGWQHADRTGREEIAQAIATAEERISEYLNFPVAPDWTVDERANVVGTQPGYPAGFWTQGLLTRTGMAPSIKARWGNLWAAGIEARSSHQVGASVVYTDTDNDGWAETATIVSGNVDFPVGELALYYPGHMNEPEWEIRPLKTGVVVGTTATITVMRSQLVIEEVQNTLEPRAVDGADDDYFLSTVDVGRHWHDPSQQAQFLWEASGSLCGCHDAGCSACYLLGQFGCAHIRDARQGFFAIQPAVWNGTTENYESVAWAVGRKPDRVRLWYRSGLRYTPPTGSKRHAAVDLMDPRMERAVAYLSTALLDRPMCACDNVEKSLSHWRTDLAERRSDSSSSYSTLISGRMLDNPLGTTLGAVYAWRIVQRMGIGEAVVVI